ncbi:MAG TPA: chloride channel protein [Acidimicrobiales bacterium]|nr:chloride channel protein [Acidimicrobiales bacterium]
MPSFLHGSVSRPRADESLADFSTTPRVFLIGALAVVVGALSAGVALGLLQLIGLLTHLLYYGNSGGSLVPPTLAHLHALSVLVPVGGGLVVGAMAYWGSERIRGHGIPEAMETILVGGSKVEPRLAVLKPVSSAISIGTGGPFGAEGPIILTGGAVGSVVAQFVHLSASERRTLLVAGACGGMAAVFGTPLAAALFGVELLVFEWRPRSVGPIAVAVVVATVLRNLMAAHGLLRAAPLFPVPPHGSFSTVAIGAAGAIGVASALLAWVLTTAVYGAEDLFRKLPVHWAWWPALGGLVVGLGGLVDPRALGVGYVQIGAELSGRLALGALATLLVVKLVIWSVALGSGTSGGILAPLLIMGAAMGGLMAPVMPGGSEATWALLGMAGTLAGVTRSPFTSVVFAFELTRDTGSLLPLLLACMVAHVVSSIVLRRSILTEKVARRGFHVVREYGVEPLEALFVGEAMLTNVLTFGATDSVAGALATVREDPVLRRQRLYPVVDGSAAMTGVVGFSDLLEAERNGLGARSIQDIAHRDVVVAWPDETLRSAADRMAEHWLGALPVVERGRGSRIVGLVTMFDLLKARHRQLLEERQRERVLTLWRTAGSRGEPAEGEGAPQVVAPWHRQVVAEDTADGGPGPGALVPRTGPAPDAHDEEEPGGDPACWAHLVCPSCGAPRASAHRPDCRADEKALEDTIGDPT